MLYIYTVTGVEMYTYIYMYETLNEFRLVLRLIPGMHLEITQLLLVRSYFPESNVECVRVYVCLHIVCVRCRIF